MKDIPPDEQALQNLIGSAVSWADGTVAGFVDFAEGDTPIEKLFYIALHARAALGATDFSTVWDVKTAEEEAKLMAEPYATTSPVIILRPQARLDDGWRVDFLLHCYNVAPKRGPRGWRKLIVECDGHGFHERTKEQAAKDRSRDRWATLNKYTILRFTGSELHKDAWGCAGEAFAWAESHL